MRKRIVFDGGYTLWSAGDDAPLAYLSTELRRRLDPEPECIVLARHPDPEFDAYFGVRTLHNLEHESKTASLDRWFMGFNYADDRAYLQRIADEVASADLLVLGAGNFLTEVSLDVLRGHLARFTVMTLLADMVGTPCMLFGLSANKLTHPWSVRAAQWMLRRASAVTFRERFAIRNLEQSGVRLPEYTLLPDAALGAPTAPKGNGRQVLDAEGIPAKPKIRLGLAVRDMSWRTAKTQRDYEAVLVEILDAWCSREGYDVLCIPQCTYDVDSPITDDRHLARRLREAARHPEKVHVFESRGQYREIEALYDEVDISLATRLHGNVFSARRGTPVIGLAYEDKVRGFYDQLGLPECCVDLEADAATILRALDSTLERADEVRQALAANVERMQSQLHGYADIAERLLQEGTSQ